MPAPSFLIATNVPIDQNSFYGSNYFLRKVKLDQEQTRPALRFLGDPYYESQLVNQAIHKSTNHLFLHDEIATPEEQVKYLIDNTAEVSQDLQLALGVALSQKQIKSLKKDILWYVQQEVHGQQVLVPQVYLTQHTIASLNTNAGPVLRSRQGAVNIKAQDTVENTGTIAGKQGVGIQAKTIHNKSIGDQQARIESSAGAVNLQAEYNIENSGLMKGATHVGLKSDKGSILHQTQVSQDGTRLLAQAGVTSGGTLALQAKNDIIGKAAQINTQGNAVIEAERDVKFLAQKLQQKTQSKTSRSSFWSSSSESSSSTHTSTTHQGSSLNIGGKLVTKGRDIALEAAQLNVAQSALFQASRDVDVTTAEDLEETEEKSQKQSSRGGLFSSSSHKSSSHKKTKQVTQQCTQINAQKFVVQSGRNATFHGAEVNAEQADIDAQGNLNIRAAYNSTHTEESSTKENEKRRWFGLSKNNHSERKNSVRGGSTATGNTWNVGTLKAHGRQGVDLEKITVQGLQGGRAKAVSITRSQGDVRDHAAKETYYNETTTTKETERRGLFGGKCEGGRLSVKVGERNSKQVDDNKKGHKAACSSYLTENMEMRSAQGKVILEGTQIDASGTTKLSGKKGVDILDALEEEEQSQRTTTEHEEWSIGLRNKFADAYLNAKDVLAAKDQLVQAKKDYDHYQAQCIVGQDELYIAAITAATANVAAKTKQFTGSAMAALGTVGSLGFSMDTEAEIEQAMQYVLTKKFTAKSANITTGNLVIESEEGDLNLRGSEFDVHKDLTLDVQNVLATASVGGKTETSTASSDKTSARVEMPLTGADVNANLNYAHNQGSGHTNNQIHNHSAIKVGGNTRLHVKKDMTLSRTQMHTAGDVTGHIGGNLTVATGTDSIDEKDQSTETSTGLSLGSGGYSPNIGAGYATSSKKGTIIKMQSGFTSDGKFAVTVEGKMKQVGAQVGAHTTGQADLHVKDGIVKEDVYSDYTESNFGINGRLGARETGGPKSAVNREPAYGKLDYGTRQVISQTTYDGQARTIADTGTQLSIDTEALQVVAKPVEKVTEIVRDTKTLYSAGEGIVNALAANTKDENGQSALGARGVWAALRFSCEDAAGLLLYQGDDERFQDSPLRDYAAGYDQDHNKTYVNTQGTDVSLGGDLMQSTYHEAQRRANAASDFLAPLSEQQQTHLAKLRGQQAGSTWERVSGARRTSRPEANTAWNTQHQKAIQQNHNDVAKHGEVKPREYNLNLSKINEALADPKNKTSQVDVTEVLTDASERRVVLSFIM